MNFNKLAWSNSLISDSNGKKISNELTINHEVDTFTCEFTTSLVGEHTIEIFIKNEKIDATPSFYTYDATKIKVGDIPPGNVGMPVDFVGKFCFWINCAFPDRNITSQNYFLTFPVCF